MYPIWLINMFTNNTCPDCRGAVTLDAIEAIGARRPEHYLAHLREPMALILATCPHCDQMINFSTRCDTQLLLDAVTELARLIETAPAGEPPLFGPGSVQSSPSDTAGRDPEKPVRPSIRHDQAAGPLTDAEIKSLLARLRRASFKPGSKSFRNLIWPDRNKPEETSNE